VVAPLMVFWASRQLPPLNSEFDLEKLMRLSVEGERMSLKLGVIGKKDKTITYQRPDFSRLPNDFVALYISQLNCPTYFQTPREEGFKWSWRMFLGRYLKSHPEGDGRCERYLGLRIAEEIGIPDGLQRDLAASRIHGFLQKDQLVAYELSGTVFDRGIVGPDDAAVELFNKHLDQLPLAQLGELGIALPMNGYYYDMLECRNPAGLRESRDGVLGMMVTHGLLAEDRYKTAWSQPITCSRTP